MSFTDDFLKGLEKRNVKQSWTKKSNDYSQHDDYTRDFLTSLEKRKKKKEEEEEKASLVEDIAPVRSDRGKADLLGLDLVQKGTFDDGYQFGDVSKAILGTAGDLGLEVLKGVGGLAEGIVDTGAYLLAGGAELLGADDVARRMRKSASKSQLDQLTGGADDFLEKYSVAGNTLDAVGQGVGQVGSLIATGGLASTGVGATMLTTGLMGVSGVGSGMSEAYESGASDDEALTYGLISGAADAFTEMIFGGLGKGINALGFGKGLVSADDILAKTVSSKFKSTVAKNLAEFGIKAGAEGLEEVFAGVIQAAGKQATYMNEEDFWDIVKDENLLEQFVVGAMTSGIAQAGSVKTANKTGRDFITGLTQNEQAVVDSLYESEIADKDLDKKEKKKIYDQILTKLDKGYIGIEDIERTLGGETYKAYKETFDSETALRDKLTASQKEYNELKGIHWREKSAEQFDRMVELETEIKNLEAQVKETTANSKLGEMKSQLSKKVFELTKNDTKLQESYREEMRRGQDLELDVEQYKGAAKITAQNLLKGGMNNTNRVHDVADLLTRIAADKNIVFDVATAQKIADAGLGVDGRFVNGVRTKDGIIINIESGKVLETTVGHELYHTFEDAGLHEELAKAIKEYAELKGAYKDRYNSAVNIYAKKDAKGNVLKDANGNIVWVKNNVDIDSEIIADLVGEYLFTDADFINNLSVKHRNVFQKIYDEIKYLVKIATAGSEEARKLEEVKRAFDKAYRSEGNMQKNTVDSGVKFSLENGNKSKYNKRSRRSETETLFLSWENGSTPVGEVKKFVRNGKIRYYEKTENGCVELSKSQYNERNGVYGENIDRRAERELGETYDFNEHTQRGSFGDFDSHRDTGGNASVFGQAIRERLQYDTAGSESSTFGHDSRNDVDQSKYYKEASDDSDASSVTWSNDYATIRNIMKEGDTADSNAKYSLSAETGKTLYTGSPVTDIQQFKVGGANGAKQTGDRYGRGIYLTTNKTTAKGYAGDSGRVYEINADDLNIFDLNNPITEEMKATLSRELNGKDKQFRNSVLRNFRTEKTFTDFESAEQFFDEQRKVWKEEDGYYYANKPEIKSADDKTGIAVIEYTDFVNIDNAIGSLTGNQLYDALKSISTDDFASFITGHGFDGIAFDEDTDNQQYVIYRNEDRLNILNNGDVAPVKYSLTDSDGRQLSKEQSEYFKDSKVVDENGNLLKLYRSADGGRTVWDGRGEGSWAQGIYLTDDVYVARAFAADGRKVGDVLEVYAKAENPFVIDAKGNGYMSIPLPEDAPEWLVDSADIYDELNADQLPISAFENGYDAVIIKNVREGVGGDPATDVILRDANQIKRTDNTKPTSDPDIRFSLSESVEETKDLVALHNLTTDKLTKSLELGGLPMPSLAVTKASIPHDNFGEITLIFGKETIDPKANKKNKVYSADAWTPTFPSVEYEADSKVVNRVNQKLRELGEMVDEEFQNDLSRVGYSIEDYLNRQGGEEGLIQYVMDNYGLKAAYLEDIGKHIEKVTTQQEVPRKFNPAISDKYEKVMEILGVNTAEEVWAFNLKEARDNHGTELEKVFPGITQSGLRMGKVLGSVAAYINGKDSPIEYKTVTDSGATRNAVDNALDAEGFEAWVRELFSGVVKDSGIYNNKDLFTPSGNRRTFKQTHLPVTLENIVKAMASQNDGNVKNVSGFNGVKTLRATTAETFKSIEEMHQRKGRLQHLTQEQADEITEALQSRLFEVIEAIDNENAQRGDRNSFIRYDQIGEAIAEIGEGGKYNVADIQNTFRQYGRTVNDDTAQAIKQLLYDVTQMPVNIFEAKPQRVVSFDEAKVFVIPNNADAKLKQELLGRGYSIAEYDPNVEGDRNRVVNQYEEYKFSLSDPNDIAPADYRKSAKYLMVDKSKAQDFGDIAPVAKRTDAPVATDDEEIKAETLVDKDSFVVRRAKELYEEITNLKKGVRASKSLGYLLDHGYEWRSIKTALLNIRDNPNQVINENSAAEAVAREMLGREYDEMVYELNEQTDVAESVRIKMQNIQTEIANNEKLREQANADYDAEIAEVQAKYDAKKNKNTIEANNLLRRIERLNRMKNTNDANYAKRIGDLEARLERMSQPTYKTAMQRKKKQSEYTTLMESLVGDTSTWVDKKLGISYKVNTLRRNLRDIVRDASGKQDIAKADAIYDELQGNYNRHEAELKRESKRLKQVFMDMKLTSAEDTYAHMLGEFRHNPDSKLTEEAVKEYYEQHKDDIDTAKVDKAIEEARKTFDELIARVNERLREQGMKEIPYRQGYFPHFTNPKQGFLAKLFNWKPVDHEIPTSIAGITETFNPERSWQSFNKQRKSDLTDYSLAQGLDTYIHGSLDWIYHIEDIQKRRALENHIRYIHSEEGVKARIDAIRNNEEYDADETQKQIDSVYAEANNPLNNFVTDLRAGTNTLAGKKSSTDRSMEEKTNRKIYSVMTNLNNRVSANMVVGSVSSALTNFIPIVQSWVEVSPMYSLRGMGDTIRSTARDDGIINKSTFLTNRLIEEEKLYQTGWDKASDKAAFLMNAIDSFTSQTVWRSKYLQNISEGMSENEAIHNADQFAENVIAGRSRGNMPTIFDAKNPLTKIFTAFQLEVSNQYGYMFKDAPTDSKNKARLVKGFATMFIGSYLYNALYSSLVGRNAAFDPLSIIEDLLGDLEDEEEEEAIVNLANNVIEEIPFVGGLLGGGRIPISSALPYSGEYEGFSKLVTDISEENWENVFNEMLSPLYYLIMPFGGGQIKKTNEGLGMFSEDHPIAGSYTASGNLRFPVEDNFINRMQAALFGQYASENARDYFDNNRTALKEKQIQEFIDVDIPIRDYWEYREGLSEQKTIEDKFDYIAGLDLPVSKKNILINNIVDREEAVDLEGYEDFSNYEEFDFATKNPEKYTVAKAVGGYNSYATHYKAMNDISADKDANGKSIVGSRKEKIIDYVNSLDIDYGMKIILFKSEYKADDTYNADILDYLNSRDDLTYEDIVTILTELDFTVDAQGNVYWD